MSTPMHTRGFLHTLRCLARGQSLLRIYMNLELAIFTLSGKVVDVGGGRDPDYFDYFLKQGTLSVKTLDGSISGIDFENDPLPYEDKSFDTALCINVLEHIYNYRFLVGEIHRILKEGGTFIGFVPFLIQYHPDPHDYFRYTKEALVRLFADAGFEEIRVNEVGGGPFLANFNALVLSVPRVFRVLVFPFYWALDLVFLKLRPRSRERYPLGYVMTAKRGSHQSA